MYGTARELSSGWQSHRLLKKWRPVGKVKGEYYISIDIETFGPCPGINSMVQFGAAFYNADGVLLTIFKRNLLELPDSVRDLDTMDWWAKQEIEFPGIMDRLMTDRVEPAAAMQDFTHLVDKVDRETGCRAVVVAYPAGFDFTFLLYYLYRFTGRSCVGISALDMKTLSMALVPGRGYRGFGKKDMPRHWFADDLPHTHDALQDATEQGHLFFSMLRDLKKLTGGRQDLVPVLCPNEAAVLSAPVHVSCE